MLKLSASVQVVLVLDSTKEQVVSDCGAASVLASALASIHTKRQSETNTLAIALI